MKTKELKKEFVAGDVQAMQAQVEALRLELLSMKLNAATAHVKDYSQFRKLRKRIARGLTVLNARNVS